MNQAEVRKNPCSRYQTRCEFPGDEDAAYGRYVVGQIAHVCEQLTDRIAIGGTNLEFDDDGRSVSISRTKHISFAAVAGMEPTLHTTASSGFGLDLIASADIVHSFGRPHQHRGQRGRLRRGDQQGGTHTGTGRSASPPDAFSRKS